MKDYSIPDFDSEPVENLKHTNKKKGERRRNKDKSLSAKRRGSNKNRNFDY